MAISIKQVRAACLKIDASKSNTIKQSDFIRILIEKGMTQVACASNVISEFKILFFYDY